MNREKKLILACAAILLSVSFVIGGTMAWLSDKTDPLENVFTYGDINITLTETTEDFKMVPGNDIDKDPVVTVKAGSEACWLFVEIVEGGSVILGEKIYTFDEFLTYTVADGWSLYVQNPTETEGQNETYVYYRKVAAADVDQPFEVLADNKVSVKDTVIKEMMNAIDGIDANGSTTSDAAKAEIEARPTLTFTAYAVQQDNIADAGAAWAIATNS